MPEKRSLKIPAAKIDLGKGAISAVDVEKFDAYLRLVGLEPQKTVEILEKIQTELISFEAKVETQFRYVEQRFKKIDQRFEKIEARLDKIEKSHLELVKRFFALEDKIERQNQKMDEKFDRLFTLIDALLKQMQDMKQENIMGYARFNRHESRMDEHEERLSRLEVAAAAL